VSGTESASFRAQRNASLEKCLFERSWFASIHLFPFTPSTCLPCDLQRLLVCCQVKGFSLISNIWIPSNCRPLASGVKPWLVASISPRSLCCVGGTRFGECKASWSISREEWHFWRGKVSLSKPLFSGHECHLLPFRMKAGWVYWSHGIMYIYGL
jgi:hypothetical protein